MAIFNSYVKLPEDTLLIPLVIEHSCGKLTFIVFIDVYSGYFLVMTNIAIEDGHLYSVRFVPLQNGGFP